MHGLRAHGWDSSRHAPHSPSAYAACRWLQGRGFHTAAYAAQPQEGEERAGGGGGQGAGHGVSPDIQYAPPPPEVCCAVLVGGLHVGHAAVLSAAHRCCRHTQICAGHPLRPAPPQPRSAT